MDATVPVSKQPQKLRSRAIFATGKPGDGLAQTDKRQYCDDDDDQAYEINNAVHEYAPWFKLKKAINL
jgi:hypothetical protein